MRQCNTCHGGGDQSLDQRCLDCHEAVAFLREQGRGLHAREGREDCARCHPEHAGRDFELVEWSPETEAGFDHEGRTGFALVGRHHGLECRQCHRAEHHVSNVVVRRRSDDADGWLGLDGRCASCHVDVHAGRLEGDCGECHGSTGWHPVEEFDHARTGYALAGAHARVECAGCHRNGRFARSERAGATWVLHGLPREDCVACHQDPHRGRFGVDCARCHTTQSFASVSSASFDHDRTRYPLRGAHRTVSCARCHDAEQGGWGKTPRFDRCARCHTDAHAGTATLAGESVDCAACHAVAAFSPATFTVDDHGRTRYPLTGRHRGVACTACHRGGRDPARHGPAGVDLRPSREPCTACHGDDHRGQLEGEAAECSRCHTPQGFAPSTFDVAAHARTDFALTGAHREVECRVCHVPPRPGLRALGERDWGGPGFVLDPPERGCADCHAEVHAGRFASAPGAGAFFSCEQCHDTRAFRPSLVDADLHARFRFSLEGGHRATPCFLCHTELQDPPLEHTLVAQSVPRDARDLSGVPTRCEACHLEGVPR